MNEHSDRSTRLRHTATGALAALAVAGAVAGTAALASGPSTKTPATPVPGKRHVAILEVHPIGNYAVRLVFDDLHSTGIFGWDYLRDLGRNYASYWQGYLDELTAKNMTRDPPARRH